MLTLLLQVNGEDYEHICHTWEGAAPPEQRGGPGSSWQFLAAVDEKVRSSRGSLPATSSLLLMLGVNKCLREFLSNITVDECQMLWWTKEKNKPSIYLLKAFNNLIQPSDLLMFDVFLHEVVDCGKRWRWCLNMSGNNRSGANQVARSTLSLNHRTSATSAAASVSTKHTVASLTISWTKKLRELIEHSPSWPARATTILIWHLGYF